MNIVAYDKNVFNFSILTEIRGKRPFIISRSSFVGAGKFAGHWSGDIASEWHDMEMTVSGNYGKNYNRKKKLIFKKVCLAKRFIDFRIALFVIHWVSIIQ